MKITSVFLIIRQLSVYPSLFIGKYITYQWRMFNGMIYTYMKDDVNGHYRLLNILHFYYYTSICSYSYKQSVLSVQ